MIQVSPTFPKELDKSSLRLLDNAQLPLVIHCFVDKLFLITFLCLPFYPKLVVIVIIDIDKIIWK